MNERALTSDDFYATLPVHADFGAVARIESYADLPADWLLVVTDIQGSTAAVERGLLKDVNLLGASSIAAVLNVVRPLEIPYVFGGDGATLAVPASTRERVRDALLATMQVASQQFGLELRAAIVPVAFLRERGRRIAVARVRSSPSYVQAAFAGGGARYAERCTKDPELGAPFRLAPPSETILGDFSGLECRWNDIASERGEIVTWLVQAIAPSEQEEARIHARVLELIAEVYAPIADAHPVAVRHLGLTLNGEKLSREARVHTAGRGARALARRVLVMRFENLLGRFFMRFRIRAQGLQWGRYRADVVANTDFRKFDDMLRHVLAGTPAQRRRLQELLDPLHRRGELVYGVHASSHALMTCLVFEREGTHVHFVDGKDGGYTLAAVDLKRRQRELPAARTSA